MQFDHRRRWKWWPRHPRHFGFRGRMLILFGVLYMFIGYSVLHEPEALTGYQLFYQAWPRELRMGLWIFSGLISIVYAFRPYGRDDAPAWLALYIMPAERAAAWMLAWLDTWVPLGGEGIASGWRAMLPYLVIIAAVWNCSGWSEPLNTEYLDNREKQREEAGAEDGDEG